MAGPRAKVSRYFFFTSQTRFLIRPRDIGYWKMRLSGSYRPPPRFWFNWPGHKLVLLWGFSVLTQLIRMWSQGWEAVTEREVPVNSGSDALQESHQLPSVPTRLRLKDPLKAGPCDAVPPGPSSDTISALVITLFRFPLENSQLVSTKSESLTAYSSPPCSETSSFWENTLLCCFPK